MKYSSKQISKVGEIITTSSDLTAVAEAVSKVNEWREQHLPVIEFVMSQIKSLFSKNGINIVFSSYRLKRMTSIQYKLDLNPDMRLGGMQDIAGGRFVFSDVTVMRSAYSLLVQASLNQLEIVKKMIMWMIGLSVVGIEVFISFISITVLIMRIGII